MIMNKTMNKKNIPSFVLYAISLLLAVYAIWAFIFCADIISQAKAAGQLAASGNGYDITSFYMGNCGMYVVYALLLTAAGLLLQRGASVQKNSESEKIIDITSNNNKNDNELDEWFSETKT